MIHIPQLDVLGQRRRGPIDVILQKTLKNVSPQKSIHGS